MSNLGPYQQNQTFDGLLQIPGGVTPQLQQVQDGNGEVTTLLLSATEVGSGLWYLSNVSAPSTPASGGYLYVKSGALYFKGSSGTETKVANA